MLNKLITHLKNIIFFKAILSIIAIIMLIVLIPTLTNDLKKSDTKYKKSYNLLQIANSKLSSMLDFEHKLPEISSKYEQLKKKSENNDCFDRQDFIKKISDLSKKHSLFEPILISISREFNDENSEYLIHNIKLNHYEIKISFYCKDHQSMLMICNEIYQILPEGAIVTNTILGENEGLTLALIKKLNTQNSPGFLSTKMHIHLREIIYES